MGPSEAVRSVLANITNFSGRASRSEYWWWVGAVILAEIIAGVIAMIMPEVGMVLYVIIIIGAIIPGLAVAVRRLHDTGRSGWWLLLGLVPLLGIVLIVFMVLDSEPGQNQWGSPPVGSRYYGGQAPA